MDRTSEGSGPRVLGVPPAKGADGVAGPRVLEETAAFPVTAYRDRGSRLWAARADRDLETPWKGLDA